ncbi:trigger factor [Mycoplasma crocodyli]|uniref:Trigger factor n=1 Tax=Mycoplasma crocodyli (strain ATCC 51981 / MP145) TaxID=512564 RepID=D5E689_MYCCM|nr:trigger factor [Mycoplasma crocodyli]ADE19906.1 trigger factor [Mycoplasma crocodyli MP145]
MSKIRIDKDKQVVVVPVVVSKEDWSKIISTTRLNIAKTIKIPGFRIGANIPQHVLDKHISNQDVMERGLQQAIRANREQAYKLAEKESKNIFYEPHINVIKLSFEELEMEYEFPMLPNFDNLDVKGIKVNSEFTKFSEKLVENEIHEMAAKFSAFKTKKEAAALGDVVVIDFKGFINNEAFEGGEAEKFELTLGSKQFIPGFEDQLVGKKAGWKGEIKVTFPDTYYVKQYRNKETIFEIVIHEVKTKDVPELKEEIISTFNLPGVSTMKQLKDYLGASVRRDLIRKAKTSFIDHLIEEVINKFDIKLNEILYTKRVDELNKDFNESLKQNGLKRAEYLEVTKATEEDIMAELRKSAEKEVKSQYVISELFKKYSTEPKTEDIEKEFDKISKKYNLPVEIVKAQINEEVVKSSLQEEQFIDATLKIVNPELHKNIEKATKDLDEFEAKGLKEIAKEKAEKEPAVDKKPATKKATTTKAKAEK